MARIDIQVHNLGMSGRPWAKHGTFNHPAQAARFLDFWWHNLSCPLRWEMDIDGLPYGVVPVPKGEAHIWYCFTLHQAFYFPDEVSLDNTVLV